MNYSRSKLMLMAVLVVTLSGCAASTRNFQEKLPDWITNSKMEDGSFYFVNCSADSLDPEEARIVAEGKCLGSAAKVAGVTVVVKSKTVQSLSGSDASESAEISPIQKNVKCDFTDRYLQSLSSGYRIWLRCRVKKSVLSNAKEMNAAIQAKEDAVPSEYKRATLLVSSIPMAEKIIVSGSRGERVLDVSGNPQLVEIKEGDAAVTLRLKKFKDAKIEIGDWNHGSVINRTIYLQQEF